METESIFSDILGAYNQAEISGDFTDLKFSSELVSQLSPQQFILISRRFPQHTCPLVTAGTKEQRSILREQMSYWSSPLS